MRKLIIAAVSAPLLAVVGELREDHHAGENLNWFGTMREAKACAESHAGSGGGSI
jgi:hypothetical protein